MNCPITTVVTRIFANYDFYDHIDEFCPENKSIKAYLELIDLYFRANDIKDEKKVLIFFSIMGGKTYSVPQDILAPVKPLEKSLYDLASELRRHFQPKII